MGQGLSTELVELVHAIGRDVTGEKNMSINERVKLAGYGTCIGGITFSIGVQCLFFKCPPIVMEFLPFTMMLNVTGGVWIFAGVGIFGMSVDPRPLINFLKGI